VHRPRAFARSAALVGLALALLLTAACDEGTVGSSAEVTVMTRNVFLGADIFRVTAATSAQDIPVIAAEIFGIMEQNDFPARAGALAAEIQGADPELIGLQEVELYRIQDPSDYVTGNTSVNATDVHLDFLQILLDSLDARGLDYVVASQVVNADVELPAARSATEFFDVRLTDRDVILARGDVTTSSPGDEGYQVIVPYELASGDTVWFERGYTWVDVSVEETDFVFVNTHLEISAGGQLGPIQRAQANQLIEHFTDASPVVAVGDFNTGPGDSPYGVLTGEFTDAWPLAGSGDGLTCCQGEFLSTTQPLESRIDLILFRGAVDALSADVVGEDLADRTASGLWPSDHAGVVATLRIEN
jgi:hypothetical protein